ncbi:MAG: APC family permease [Alphaproteobacteria bacterium]|nr:APC family permease [Alphaproteobacteria bacterium]
MSAPISAFETAPAAAPKLRLLDTVLYALATGIGMRWIAVAAAVGPSSLPLWLLALVVFFIPLSVATAELTARFDAEGGIYAWVRDTLGPLSGFLCGWFYWIGLMPYFASILYFLSGLILAALHLDPSNTFAYVAISVALTVLVTGLQLLGLGWGKWLPHAGATGGWIVLGVIVAMAAVIGGRGQGATDFAHSSYLPPLDFGTAILWGTIFFAYSGAEAVAFLRNEIEGGMRTVIRALIVLGIGSVIVYLVGTASFLVILPKEALTRLAGFPDALRIGLEHVGLGGLAPAVIALFALSMMGSFTGWFGLAARLPFAAGIDSYLPKVFAWRHPRTGAPVPALLLQAALTLVMVALSQAGTSVAGAYDFLVAMSVLGTTLPYIFMFIGYLKASRLPPVPGAWAPPGGPRTSIMLGWLALVSTVIAIACTLVPSSSDEHPWAAFVKIVLATAAMTVAGLGVYWAAKRR